MKWRSTLFIGAAVCAASSAFVLSGCGGSDRVTGPDPAAEAPAEQPAAPPDGGTAAAAVACTIDHLSMTMHTPQAPHLVRAVASFQGCSSPTVTVTMRIQRYTGWLLGWRDTGAQTGVRADGRSYSVIHNCYGDGIQSYRAIVSGRTVGDLPKTKHSNEIRTNCGG
jgi:hypothetical protein